jgi:hypothetical protein
LRLGEPWTDCSPAAAGGRTARLNTTKAANRVTIFGEFSRKSTKFAAMWRDNDVRTCGEGTKHLCHPKAGLIGLEYSAFAVDGRPISAW